MNNKNTEASVKARKQIPIQEGLFHQPASPDEKPYLLGTRCTACGNVTFPRMEVCPRCVKKGTMEETGIEGKGRIDTFSIVQAALPGFKAPSIQAYINLDAGPRIWSLIVDNETSGEDLKIGMEVELIIAPVRVDEQGNELISYQFRPVRS
jgi:uncharacterized protein